MALSYIADTGTTRYTDLLDLTSQVAGVGDIRQARAEAARRKDEEERQEESQHVAKAKEYNELHDQLESSLTLLNSLESFISTFQTDLSAVSGHIADLQGRSKVIEARLENRKAVRNGLSPLLSSITVSPALIDTLMETEPSEAWLQPVADLEKTLLAVRSGARTAVRQNLDGVVEKLRIRVTYALRGFLINLLTPYRTSITPNLSILQNSVLTKYRSFFAFLQRHAARVAHEVQKAYISTAQWYYETGFRRYVRALEKIRAKSIHKEEPIGVIGSAEAPLTLLSRRSVASMSAGLDTPRPSMDAHPAKLGPDASNQPDQGVVLAYQADDPAYRASPDTLFRSISLVLADNARSEYAFVSSFFGRPEDLEHPITADMANVTFMRKLSADKGALDTSSSAHDDESASVLSGETSFFHAGGSTRAEKHQKHIAETIWKQVFDASLEYARNFINAILTQSYPTPLSMLSMIRLNDTLMEQLVGDNKDGKCPTSTMESHLIGLRLLLWPIFQKEMGNNVDSVKKLYEGNSGGMAGMLGVRSTVVKDSVVAAVAKRYSVFFTNIVSLSADQEDAMVFNSLLRLRNEVQKLVNNQAMRLNNQAKASAYLKNQYEHILSSLTDAPTSHPRSQAEIAYWREALRKA